MKNMNIEAGIKNLKKILCEDEIFYSIPIYQRPYSWDTEQIETLLDDLLNAYQNQKDSQYFCGSIVITESETEENRYDIIDGQQRLTSFTIIACVIRDFFSRIFDQKTVDIVKKSIKDIYDDDKPKLKLKTDIDKQNDFMQTVINKVDLQVSHNKNKYLGNAKHIYKCLEIYNQNINISDFVKWIYDKVVLASIECTDEDTAVQIFNILNDRGIQLSSIDIIKSNLMQKITKKDREIFKSDWDNINNELENNDLKIDDMFYAYSHYCIPQTTRKMLHKELLPYFYENLQFKSILKIIHEIKDFSKAYINIIKISNDKHTHTLKYLRNKLYWTSILTTSKFENYESHEELKKYLISYYYQNWISGGHTNRIKQTSCNIISYIKKKEPISKIKQEIENNMQRHEMKKYYTENLNGKDVNSKNWIKPLLCMLEYRYTDNSKTDFIPLDKKLEIEHVLPRTPEQGKWEHITKGEKSELTHCLGNLTLLSMIKNRQALNFEYNKKINIYIDGGDDVATSFEISRRITRKYEEWTADTIKERKEELINDINDMLSI